MRIQLEKDLERKLTEDTQRVTEHYFDMCEIADIPTSHQLASVMHVFCLIILDLALAVRMDKDCFIESISASWDRMTTRRDLKKM